MKIVNAYIDMQLPHAESLKGRRAILNAIKEKLKKYNLSQLDLSGDYPKEAMIAIIYLSPDEVHAIRQIERIETELESAFVEVVFAISYEIA